MLTAKTNRQELVAWLNNLLQLNITKVEQCGTGYVMSANTERGASCPHKDGVLIEGTAQRFARCSTAYFVRLRS